MNQIKQIDHITSGTIQKHGLNPEQSAKIFSKFYMGQASHKSELNGLNAQSVGNTAKLPSDRNSRTHDTNPQELVSTNQDNTGGTFQNGGSGYRTRAVVSTGSWIEPQTEMEKDFAIDAIITQLVEVQSEDLGKLVKLPERAIKWLIQLAQEIFQKQEMMINLEINSEQTLNIVGDIHGQYSDLLRIFDYAGYPSQDKNYLFIGDYVDRGKQSIEVISLLLAFKIKYPGKFNLLRGNHESQAINRSYGFYDECKRRYTVTLWTEFCKCFNFMPVSAIIEDRILCMHGGLSPELHSLEQIKNLDRPSDVPDNGLLCDLLWSDPDKDVLAWGDNERGVSHTFGSNIVQKFNQKHDIDLICRAHQVVEDGYEFFADRGLVTVFSAPNYYGEWDNAAAIMIIDEHLICKFKIIQPAEKKDLLQSDRWFNYKQKTKHPNALNGINGQSQLNQSNHSSLNSNFNRQNQQSSNQQSNYKNNMKQQASLKV